MFMAALSSRECKVSCDQLPAALGAGRGNLLQPVFTGTVVCNFKPLLLAEKFCTLVTSTAVQMVKKQISKVIRSLSIYVKRKHLAVQNYVAPARDSYEH